jgi:hypothetical protein
VSLADTISTASAFGPRAGQEIDGNGEMLGTGPANPTAGLSQGFLVSTRRSRTGSVSALSPPASRELSGRPAWGRWAWFPAGRR